MIRDVDALRENQWERLQDLVPGGRAGQRGPRCDNRRFADALLWMARSGGALARSAGTLRRPSGRERRHYRWIERGALDGFLAALTAEADVEWLMIGSTIVMQRTPGDRKVQG